MSSNSFTKLSVNLKLLPLELGKLIMSYISLDECISNETKLIKNIISVYNIDHDPDLTKRAKMYYIKNIMSFKNYFFSTIYKDYINDAEDDYDYETHYYTNYDYGCVYGRQAYDTLKLSETITLRIKDAY